LPLRHYLISAIFIIDDIIDDIDTLILISFHYAIIDITHYAIAITDIEIIMITFH
jgi:hypothetical protein